MQTPRESDLTYDVACAECGYLLRGLEPGGRCPECGAEIATSVEASRRSSVLRAVRRLARPRTDPPAPLALNSPAWLRTAALGTLALALLIPAAAAGQWWRRDVHWALRVPEYPLLAMCVVFAVAVWLVTWPDRPRPAVRNRYWDGVRWWLRTTSLTPAAAAALACYSEVVPAYDHAQYAVLAMQPAAILPLVCLLLFDYLAYLSRRLERPWFAGFLRATMIVATAWSAIALPVALSNFRHQSRVLFPDFVGEVIEIATTACCGLGGTWSGVLVLAMLDLSMRLWRLAGRSRSAESASNSGAR